MESVFQDCVREVKAQGRTVLLSSHILAEVEALCDRVSIIRSGRTVETGSLVELRRRTQTSVVAQTDRRPTTLASLAGVSDLELDDHTARFSVEGARPRSGRAPLADHGLRGLTCQPPTLEELFLRDYGDVVAEERRRSQAGLPRYPPGD